MRAIAFGVSIVLGFGVAGCARGAAKRSVSDETMRDAAYSLTYELVTVGSSVVGSGGTPDSFYLVSQMWRRFGDRTDYDELIDDEYSVVARVMGLTCLAATNPDAAPPVLRRHMDREAEFDALPYGCIGDTLTEGEYATRLLLDWHFARWYIEHDMKPLLVGRAHLGFCLYLLAHDRYVAYHKRASRFAGHHLERMGDDAALARLADAAPELPELDLIRAIGRVEPNEQTRGVLMAVASDERFAGSLSLAAGWALTRDPAEAVGMFLEESDYLFGETMYAVLRQAWEVRRDCERLIPREAPNPEYDDPDFVEREYPNEYYAAREQAAEVRVARLEEAVPKLAGYDRLDHPAALDAVIRALATAQARSVFDEAPGQPEHILRLAEALVRCVERPPIAEGPEYAYSDTLARIAYEVIEGYTLNGALSDAQRDRIWAILTERMGVERPARGESAELFFDSE